MTASRRGRAQRVGQVWKLEPGDVVVFRGDQSHGYRNPGAEPAVAYSVIALAPLAG